MNPFIGLISITSVIPTIYGKTIPALRSTLRSATLVSTVAWISD
jgi:hypothetical protein